MTTLTRWNPFKQPMARMDPISDFEDMFRGFGLRPLMRDVETPPELRMDVTEDDKSYLVKVDVPGVKKEDIEVSIDGAQVLISAEIRRETKKEEGKQIHAERYYGNTYRTFTLPHEVDDSKARAQYDNGVLNLVLPKKAGTRSHKIAIQ